MNKLLAAVRARLIDDVHQAWRLTSVQINSALVIFLAAYQLVPAIPAEIAAIIPGPWRAPLLAAWAAIGVLARIYKQKHPNG